MLNAEKAENPDKEILFRVIRVIRVIRGKKSFVAPMQRR
jgi:hypothetical protein